MRKERKWRERNSGGREQGELHPQVSVFGSASRLEVNNRSVTRHSASLCSPRTQTQSLFCVVWLLVGHEDFSRLSETRNTFRLIKSVEPHNWISRTSNSLYHACFIVVSLQRKHSLRLAGCNISHMHQVAHGLNSRRCELVPVCHPLHSHNTRKKHSIAGSNKQVKKATTVHPSECPRFGISLMKTPTFPNHSPPFRKYLL